MVPEEETVNSFVFSRQIQSGKITLRDFNFEKPSLDLTAQHQGDSFQKLEVYDYPGEYLDQSRGKKLAEMRLQEAVMFEDKAEGQSVCPRFIPGFTFKLSDHERESLNQEYLLVEVLHSGSQPQTLEEQAGMGGSSYSNQFLCIPSSVTLRPERNTPKPIVEGIQTAIVGGPAGEEIYTDEHGRVKVQFHWDREGNKDEKSSCWIRVSQAWAGAGWGAMYIPRIGHEVIVDFIEGDPDRPIITGRVYHGTNKPPYDLPGEKTKSTIKSDSSLGGGGSNEFRFEDKKGEEEVYLHGQKDWTIKIENDKNQDVGNDETLNVGNNRDKSVGKNQSESIGENKSISVGKNHTESIEKDTSIDTGQNKTESVGKNDSLTVGENKTISIGKNLTEDVSKNTDKSVGENFSINIGKNFTGSISKQAAVSTGKDAVVQIDGNFNISCNKKAVIEIKDQLTLNCGKASITLKKNGDILINGGKLNFKASGDIVMKGSKISQN
jgi:type VI secretion system secreted protein VgrG